MGPVRRWSSRRDQLEWPSGYLRGARGADKGVDGGSVGSVDDRWGSCVFDVYRAGRSVGRVRRVVGGFVFGYVFGWVRRWRTQAQSLVMALGGSGLIAAGCRS